MGSPSCSLFESEHLPIDRPDLVTCTCDGGKGFRSERPRAAGFSEGGFAVRFLGGHLLELLMDTLDVARTQAVHEGADVSQ